MRHHRDRFYNNRRMINESSRNINVRIDQGFKHRLTRIAEDIKQAYKDMFKRSVGSTAMIGSIEVDVFVMEIGYLDIDVNLFGDLHSVDNATMRELFSQLPRQVRSVNMSLKDTHGIGGDMPIAEYRVEN